MVIYQSVNSFFLISKTVYNTPHNILISNYSNKFDCVDKQSVNQSQHVYMLNMVVC
jgi:hypothetical protein